MLPILLGAVRFSPTCVGHCIATARVTALPSDLIHRSIYLPTARLRHHRLVYLPLKRKTTHSLSRSLTDGIYWRDRYWLCLTAQNRRFAGADPRGSGSRPRLGENLDGITICMHNASVPLTVRCAVRKTIPRILVLLNLVRTDV